MKTIDEKKRYVTATALFALFIALAAASVMLFVPSVRNARAEGPNWTPDAGWETSVDGNETIYKHTAEYSEITSDAEFSANKSFSIDVNYKDVAFVNGGVNNFGAWVYVDDPKDDDTAKNYFFVFITNGNAIHVRYSKNGDAPIASATHAFPSGQDVWFNLKIVLIGENLCVFVDGEQKLTVANPDAANVTLANTKIGKLSSWGIAVSVKDPIVTAKTGDDPSFDPAAYSYSIENGEGVFTHLRGGGPDVIAMPATGGYNTFSADVRLDAATAGDCNMSLSVRLNETESYLFEYNPHGDYARLRYFDAEHAAEGVERGKSSVAVAAVGKWVELKAVFERDYLVFYVNGKRAISYFDTGDDDFSNVRAEVSMWGVFGSVKNPACETTDKDYADVAYVDLEFKKQISAMVFEAHNGDISWDETCGALELAVGGSDPSLTSPRIEVAEGSIYSMKLPVRNTFLVRMKNGTKADRLTLNYITAVDGSYDGVKQKTFAIEPNSDYRTYYFNISDVADCGHWKSNAELKACRHFLRGFKFTFEGATDGTIAIDAITFEREDRIWEHAATAVSALADKDKKTVTVGGTLLSKYAGQTVTIYETSVKNHNELLSYKDNVKIAEGTANERGEFSVTFPLVRENGVSHLSTVFLGAVNGVKLCNAFMIDNWRDFSENPYAFELQDYSVRVTDALFGAKGDGFTNDNAAIQAAIDHVSAQGGGSVVLPGDASNPFGRRYIATCLNMKNNVELDIEKGAVLWQSERFEDYAYDGYSPVYGHDIYIEGTPWTHAAASWNMPFIYANGVENVRVTGGGEIRMMDTGTQWLDGNSYGDSDIVTNCASVIHLHAFASYDSENVEVSDITTKRGNIWHMPNTDSRNLYFGNVRMTEVSCINGDGLSFLYGTSNVCIDRCTLYSNDDAIVCSAAFDDPRGHTEHSWWDIAPDPEKFNGVQNFEISRSNMYGGHGLTFITWGSHGSNEENVEIRDFRVTDNVLGGTSTSVGCWTDNPFYGESHIVGTTVVGTYSQWEKDDYSPIKNLYIMNNIYTDPCLLGTWAGDTPEIALATNAMTDCDIYSPDNFVNGSFDKRLKNENEKTWETRLAYWSYSVDDGGEVGVEKRGTKLAPVKGTDKKLEIDDHAAFIKGGGELYQGLYKDFGAYEFSADIKLMSGGAEMFVRDAVSGKILAEKELTASDGFETVKIPFTLGKSAAVQLGVVHTGEAWQIVYIDDAALVAIKDPAIYDVDGTVYEWNFDSADGLIAFDQKGREPNVSGGTLSVPNDLEYKVVVDQVGKIAEFDMGVDLIFDAGTAINAGVYFAVGAIGREQDKIDAYNVQIEYDPSRDTGYYVRLFEFSYENGFIGRTAQSAPIALQSGATKISLRTVVKSGVLFVFADGSDEYALTYRLSKDYVGGNVGLRSQKAPSKFDNFYVKTAEFVAPSVDMTELGKSVALANKFAGYAYTKESFAKLEAALNEAKALPETVTQKQVDALKAKIDAAIDGLVKLEADPTPPEPEVKIEYVTKTVTEKDIGMTVGFYVMLGLFAASAAATVVLLVRIKKKGGKG